MKTEYLKKIYDRLISNGLEGEVSEDDLRRVRIVNSVSTVLLITLFAFVFLDLLVFKKPYAAGVEFMAFLSGVVYLNVQRQLTNVALITNFSVAIMVSALIGIGLLNGINTSTTFWFYMIPPFAFYVSGVKNGFIWSSLIFLWMLIFTALAVNGTYGGPMTLEYATDVLLAFIIVTLLAFLFEYARFQAAQALSTANEEMRRLIYIVSHDLRTPLTALRGYSEFLKEDVETSNDKEIGEDIERIELMAVNMGKMIDDLLNLSRIGRHSEEKEVINTREVADTVVAENEPNIIAKKIRVEIVEPLPRMYGNRRKFEEVMRNLVSNAIKYMGESKDPYIKIGAVDKVKEYHFYVSDHGIGIEKKYHDKIFGLFVRHETMGEGSGIGLSIVKGFVEDMGGSVWIESKLGEGSKFWFSIPKETPPVEKKEDVL